MSHAFSIPERRKEKKKKEQRKRGTIATLIS